jgi:hypothetical protein
MADLVSAGRGKGDFLTMGSGLEDRAVRLKADTLHICEMRCRAHQKPEIEGRVPTAAGGSSPARGGAVPARLTTLNPSEDGIRGGVNVATLPGIRRASC